MTPQQALNEVARCYRGESLPENLLAVADAVRYTATLAELQDEQHPARVASQLIMTLYVNWDTLTSRNIAFYNLYNFWGDAQ